MDLSLFHKTYSKNILNSPYKLRQSAEISQNQKSLTSVTLNCHIDQKNSKKIKIDFSERDFPILEFVHISKIFLEVLIFWIRLELLLLPR